MYHPNRTSLSKDNSSRNPSTDTFNFHTSPEPPPMKKQRGTVNQIVMETSSNKSRNRENNPTVTVPNPMPNSVAKKISTRREELQKLKQRLKPQTSGSSILLARAKTHLDASLGGRRAVEISKLPTSIGNGSVSTRSSDVQSVPVPSPSRNKNSIYAVRGTQSMPSNNRIPAPDIRKKEETRSTKSSSEIRTEEKKNDQDYERSNKKHNDIWHSNSKNVQERVVPESLLDEFDDPNYSMLVTPQTAEKTQMRENGSNTPVQPRKLNLSSSKKAQQVKKNAMDDQRTNSTSSTSSSNRSGSGRNIKSLSTTSSQKTKERSHRPQNLRVPVPPPKQLEPYESPKDPVKQRAEKSLQKGEPIDSKRGLLYAVGKYASDNQSSNVSTYTEGLSTLASTDNHSVDTRGSTSSQNTRRLVLQLREANEEKSEALRNVARLQMELEGRIRKDLVRVEDSTNKSLKSPDDKNVARSGALAMLICITDRKVERAMLRRAWNHWKEEISTDHEDSKLFTNGAIGMRSPATFSQLKKHIPRISLSQTKGALISSPLSPIPRPSPAPSHAVNISTISKKYLKDAFKVVAKEYKSSIATYNIRLPTENGIYSVMPQDVYEEVMDPNIPETLEIRANIFADDSVLILYGEMSCRHVNKDGLEMREIEIVHDGGMLGIVPYIDCDGIEGEYILDEIFQEAIASRNSYCASLVSAVLTLQAVAESKTNISYTNTGFDSKLSSPKHSSKLPSEDKGGVRDEKQQWDNDTEPSGIAALKDRKSPAIDVDTQKASEMKQAMPEKSTTNPPVKQTEQKIPATTSHKELNSKPEENVQSSDMFSFLLLTMFKIVFGTFFFVFIKLPIKIAKWVTCTFFFAIMICSIWLVFADDNGGYKMGAMINDYIRPEF